jgi:cobalt-zinc-cadmium efflux system protein
MPPAILGGPMLGVAVVGLVVNLACAGLLHGAAETSLNVRAAYLEVLGDALSSLGVVVAGALVVVTGWTLADPLVSGAIALVIVPRTWRLLRQAVNVLLEGTPAHLNLGEIEEAMRSVSGVRRVHDLHVWTLTSEREAMSAHVVVVDVRDSERLLETLHAVLHARFGIDHTTIQLEMEPSAVLRIQGPSSA